MKKILTFALFVSLLSFGYAGHLYAAGSVEIIEACNNSVSIVINGSTLRVFGASGQFMYIYNVAGVRVKSVKVDGDDKYYTLNLPKGCYIVKVGDVVRKISIS